MIDPQRAVETLLQAAQCNREDPLLRGSLLHFPSYGQVVMTGDLHGHRRNFARLQKYCDLQTYAARHVLLHELIHIEPTAPDDQDHSYMLVLEAAAWKCAHPEQVHFLLSNHELAQISGNEITKNGRIVTYDFETAVAGVFGKHADAVLSALYAFIRSYALAGRTPNRVFLSHSLPGPRDVANFDPMVFQRAPTAGDLADRGSAHSLVWGRYQTDNTLQTLRTLLDVDYFVCGHQPQDTGFDVIHERMVIIASDHNHGVYLPIDLNKPVTLESLTKAIRPFAAIA